MKDLIIKYKSYLFLAGTFIIGVMLGGFISVRIAHLSNYHIDTESGYLITLKDTITINTVPTDDYVEFSNVKIGNFFEDFHMPPSSFGLNTFLHNTREDVGFWWSAIPDDEIIGAFLRYWENVPGRLPSRQAILDRHNITNDNEFLRLLSTTRANNMFTSVGSMRERYVMHTFAQSYFSYFDNIALVDGDYIGRMIFYPKNRELQIHKNNRIYAFTFFNTDYWTDEKINEVINSIVILELLQYYTEFDEEI